MGKIDPKIIKALRKFKEASAKKYHVLDIIFFGSRATGTYRKDSDIDLLVVVKEYDKGLYEKLITEWHDRQNIHYPVDFIQCSKKRFDEMSKGINIVSQALKEGMVI